MAIAFLPLPLFSAAAAKAEVAAFCPSGSKFMIQKAPLFLSSDSIYFPGKWRRGKSRFLNQRQHSTLTYESLSLSLSLQIAALPPPSHDDIHTQAFLPLPLCPPEAVRREPLV